MIRARSISPSISRIHQCLEIMGLFLADVLSVLESHILIQYESFLLSYYFFNFLLMLLED